MARRRRESPSFFPASCSREYAASQTSSDEPESLKDRNEDIGTIVIVVVSERSKRGKKGKTICRKSDEVEGKWSESLSESFSITTKKREREKIEEEEKEGSFRTEDRKSVV